MGFKQSFTMNQFVVTKIIDYLQVPKNKLLLPADYYDKILVLAENYSYIGLLGKIDNSYVVIDYESLNRTDSNYLECVLIDGIDYRHLTVQLILNILTNYEIANNEIEHFSFDHDEFIVLTKVTQDINKQLHLYSIDNVLLQLNFALGYNSHFTQRGFLLRENLNYLKYHKNIDFVYDYDMVINPVIGISFWNYNIFIDFTNFVILFKELYTYALTFKNLN